MKKLLVVFLFSLSSIALADVIPPDVASCSGKKSGEVCDAMGAAGVCQESTCSRLDYSQGSPPKGTIDYPCMKCAPGAAKPAEPKTEPEKVEPAKVDPPTKTRGCAVDPLSEGGALAGVMLLSGIALLARRRR